MATDQDLRPRYYEDQYLGADDLDQAVLYGRIQQARHALGAHTWGISIGLDLVEKPRPGGGKRVDVFLTPGYAWDGYGRPIVVLAPFQLQEARFADIKFDPQNANHVNGKGDLVPVWLQYDQQELRPPARGFETCREGDNNSRIQETFRIIVGSLTGADLHGNVVINSTEIAPRDAISRFDSVATASGTTPGRTVFDESIPHQQFPTDDPSARWPIPIGSVRWLPVAGGTGQFVARDDSGNPTDTDLIREQRRYAGVVVERIEGAGGVIRLRNRFADPDKVSFHAPRTSGENEVVWVEGDLRVVGDARLAGGKLAWRTADGKDGGTPLEVRRTESQSGAQGDRTLQVIIGPEGQDTNRFAVGRLKLDQSVDQKFVVTSVGNVGIGTAVPSGRLDVANLVRVALDEGGSGSKVITFARDAADEINAGKIAYKPTWDTGALAIVGAGNPPHRKIRMWEDVIIEGALGVGTNAPNGKLDVANLVRVGLDEGQSGPKVITFARDAADEINAGKIAYKPAWDTGALAIVGAGNPPHRRIRMWEDVIIQGNVGIGASNPAGKIDIDETGALSGSRLKIGHSASGFAHHITSFRDLVLNSNNGIYIRHNPTAGDPNSINELVRITSAGRVGIATTSPGYMLHVNGSAAKPGGGNWTASSDKRLKKNVEPLRDALKRLVSLRGVEFEWKEPEKQGNLAGKQIGLIAQDVEKVFPDWVGTDEEGYKDLTIRGFEALTVEAFKEVLQEIETLKRELTKQEESAKSQKSKTNRRSE